MAIAIIMCNLCRSLEAVTRYHLLQVVYYIHVEVNTLDYLVWFTSALDQLVLRSDRTLLTFPVSA